MGWRSTSAPDRAGEEQHDADRQHHGRDHDRQVLGHADRGDDRVEREDHVEDGDLRDDHPEGAGAAGALLVRVGHLELLVDLRGGLGHQEEAAAHEHQVAAGDVAPEDREERRGEPHDPADGEEERQPRAEREEEAELARLVLLRGRQPAGEDGQEDDVVDAEDDLEGRQGGQRDPGFGLGEEVQDGVHPPLFAQVGGAVESPAAQPPVTGR